MVNHQPTEKAEGQRSEQPHSSWLWRIYRQSFGGADQTTTRTRYTETGIKERDEGLEGSDPKAAGGPGLRPSPHQHPALTLLLHITTRMLLLLTVGGSVEFICHSGHMTDTASVQRLWLVERKRSTWCQTLCKSSRALYKMSESKFIMVAVGRSTSEIRPALKGINEHSQSCNQLLSNLMLFAGPALLGLTRHGRDLHFYDTWACRCVLNQWWACLDRCSETEESLLTKCEVI